MTSEPGSIEERERSLLAYQPRRPVPWLIADLLAVVIFYFALQGAILLLFSGVFGRGMFHTAVGADADPSKAEHVVIRLMAGGGPWILLLCVVSAAVVAPICEEFLFRVLFQGWLEAAERRWRHRRRPRSRHLVPRAIGPILLSSLLFAGMHFRRIGVPQPDALSMTVLIAIGGAANLFTVLFAIALLRWRAGATAVDFGWVPGKLRSDLRLGLTTCAVVVVPIYAIQGTLPKVQELFPKILPPNIAPDPIPLFFFAIVLGFLYFRTHRIAPAVVLHASLNATSLMLAWLAGGLGN